MNGECNAATITPGKSNSHGKRDWRGVARAGRGGRQTGEREKQREEEGNTGHVAIEHLICQNDSKRGRVGPIANEKQLAAGRYKEIA